MLYCKCDCGNEKEFVASNVVHKKTLSCGCYHREQTAKANKKYNTYDLSGTYGIGYTTKGEEFYFDLEDFNKIKDYCWNKNDQGYIRAKDIFNNNSYCVRIHRIIMEITDKNIFIDHINHDRHDNRKCNLRVCNPSQNSRNIPVNKSNKLGVAGVSFDKAQKKYEAYIRTNGKKKFLGYYTELDDAVKARKEAEEKYYGEYSYDKSMEIAKAYEIKNLNNQNNRKEK